MRHIDQQIFKKFLKNETPNHFVGIPDITVLNIGGVKFNYLWTNTRINDKGCKVYIHDYQSEEQTVNGYYVMAEVKVIEKVSKSITRYVFDNSSIGSRLY